MRSTFVRCITNRAESDERIFLITPDIGYSIFEDFASRFPDKFLNVGVAEQNAIGVAAGLALSGKIVYVYGIIPFLTMRCFEQIRINVAYMNTNVRLVGVGAGLTYGSQGATHHAIEDIAIMRALPNMTICCPGDPVEVRGLVESSFSYQGPIYFRLGKNGEPSIHDASKSIVIGEAVKVREGKDIALITTSNMLLRGKEIVDELVDEGIDASLISMHTIKPLDTRAIERLVSAGTPIVTLEEHNIIGGLGSAVAEVIALSGATVRFRRYGIPDSFVHSVGNQEFLRSELGMDRIAEDIKKELL